MRYEDFVADVMTRGGFEAADEADRAITVVARVLGERLLADERDAVAAALPGPAAHPLEQAAYERDFDLDDLYDRVARREGVAHGFAREHTQAVCQAIGELLPEDVRLRLEKALPPDLHALFAPRHAGRPPPRPVHAPAPVAPGTGTTLATGRPGSHHAVSEARPERAHSQSVARSADPHADTRLSSTHGLTQEREGETLAEGHPGPAHPVSTTRR